MLQSKLVIVDERDGQILGDLDTSNLKIEEDPILIQKSNEELAEARDSYYPNVTLSELEKDPVVIDLDQSTVKISPLSHLTQNFGQSDSRIIRFSEYVSRGIIHFTEQTTSSLQTSTSNYMSKNPPTQSPLTFNPVVKGTLSSVHGFSDTG